MKYITLLLLLLVGVAGEGADLQPVRFRHLRAVPDAKYYRSVWDDSIDYPIVVAGNAVVGQVINRRIKEGLLGDRGYKGNVREQVEAWRHDGLTSMEFEATLNDGRFLSLRVDYSTMTAYPANHVEYYNFDMRTGKVLGISDVLKGEVMGAFRDRVLRDKRRALDDYERDLRAQAVQHIPDSDYYADALDLCHACREEVNLEQFSLTKDTLTVIDDCEFPHFNQALQPWYDLKYGFDELGAALRPLFQLYRGELSVRFREVKAVPRKQFYDTRDSMIVYPLIVLKDRVAAKRMNDVIEGEIFVDNDEPGSLREKINDWRSSGLTTMSYSASYNANGILSMGVYVGEGGGHLIRHDHHFNFDIKTGATLGMGDLFKEPGVVDSFRRVVQRDKEPQLKKMGLDEGDLAECRKLPVCDEFILTGDGIEIVERCVETHDFNLQYGYKRLAGWLRDTFRDKIGVGGGLHF